MAVTLVDKTAKDGASTAVQFVTKRGQIDTSKDIPAFVVVDPATEALVSLATDATLAAASAKLPATLGQKAMTASMSVVIASDQGALPVATHAVSQFGTWNVGLSGTLPAFAATPTVNLGTIAGVATEATLAAASGKLPASLGAKAGSASLSVVPATDGVFSVSGFQSTPKVTLSANTATYAPGDVVGVVTAIPIFRTNGGSGVLAHVSIRSRSTTAQTPSLTVFLFETPPAAQTNNAALSLSAAEWDTVVGIVPLTLAAPVGVPAGFTFTEAAANLSIPVKNGNSTTNLYAIVTTGTAFTLVAATDLVIQARLSQD